MPTIPLFGKGVGRKSSNVSAQARVNLYAEQLSEPDKTPLAFYPRPGLLRMNAVDPSGNGGPSGPIRGMIAAQTNGGVPTAPVVDIVFYVAGQYGVTVTSPTVKSVPTTTDLFQGNGPVRMAFDGVGIVALDNLIGHYVTVPSGASAKITDINFPNGARSVTFLGGRFYVDDPTSPGRYRWSDIYNGQSWPALNFATAEQNPDPLTGVFEAHGQLLLFGTRTLEFWALQPTGFAGTQPVTAVPGSTIMWGTEAYDSIRKVGDRVVFLGRNSNGDRKVVALEGYTPTPISDPEVEADINADPAPDVATACVSTKGGHTFYVLNLSTKSWAFDVESGNWDIWSTDGGRWGGNWIAAAFGQVVASDYRDQRIYTLDVSTLTDDANVMGREFTTRHVFGPDLQRLSITELVVDMQTGVGLVSGQGVAPVVMASWSKDGGHTFGNEVQMSIGAMGNYRVQAVLRMLGIAKDWVFRFRITDPVTTAIIGAAAVIR